MTRMSLTESWYHLNRCGLPMSGPSSRHRGREIKRYLPLPIFVMGNFLCGVPCRLPEPGLGACSVMPRNFFKLCHEPATACKSQKVMLHSKLNRPTKSAHFQRPSEGVGECDSSQPGPGRRRTHRRLMAQISNNKEVKEAIRTL